MNWYELLFYKFLKTAQGKSRLSLLANVFKGGTEQLLPVNDDEPTTSPLLADMMYSDGYRPDQEFTFRQSPATVDGKAKLKSIKGNTVVWNQLEANDNTTGTSNGITYTNNRDGSWTVSGTATSTSEKVPSASHITGVNGHKYLFKGCPSGGTSSTYMLRPVINGSAQAIGFRDYGGGVIIECTTDSNPVYTRITIPNGNTIDGIVFHPQIFDLTTMFGSGNEPTIEEFTSLFPLSYYAYNSGSLLNFNGTGIKTTGKNLVNYINSRTSGGTTFEYDSITGGVSVSGTNTSTTYSDVGIDSADLSLYTIIPAGVYTASIQSDTTRIRVYVGLKSLATGVNTAYSNIQTSQTFTVTEPSYLFTRVMVLAGTYDTVVYPMVSGSSDATFEPYTSSTLSLPISTYFPNGMKSAGSVYDELTNSKAITRIGSVDLGTLDYTYSSGVFISTGDFSGLPSVTSVPTPCCCDKYTSLSASTTLANMPDKSVVCNNIAITNSRRTIAIKDSSYTDASTFKTAMSGIYLNYELATPTEQDVSDEDANLLLNRALSTILGRTVSVDNPQEALDIVTKGE